MGQMVYSFNTIHSGWDGRLLGNAQLAGTYVWQLKYTEGNSQQTVTKSGTVVLIR